MRFSCKLCRGHDFKYITIAKEKHLFCIGCQTPYKNSKSVREGLLRKKGRNKGGTFCEDAP